MKTHLASRDRVAAAAAAGAADLQTDFADFTAAVATVDRQRVAAATALAALATAVGDVAAAAAAFAVTDDQTL